ncbi:hypothetical protein, partial [Desertihabitans aurantiacus]|uniref:hypothetical protein n=1 Tax=Desertihabitans aurantiacus TaxID=2282477 RepID=UPI0013009190
MSREGGLTRLLVVVALLPVLLGLPVIAGTTPRAAAEGPEQTAVGAYGGCLVGAGAGDLLLLFDESASLIDTDPDDQRVRAADYLVRQLGRFAEQREVALDVAVATFGVELEGPGRWSDLAGSGDRVRDDVAALAEADDGWETDYWTALNGARQALADKAAGEERCQAVLWFSDGSLDLDDRTDPAEAERYGERKPYAPDVDLTRPGSDAEAERRAADDLCRDGGVADQLRRAPVTVFGIGLSAGGGADFDLMRGISTGEDGCGAIQGPTVGSFTEADSIESLIRAFDRLQNPGQEPTTTEREVCQGEMCPEGRHPFVLDDSISEARALFSTDAEVPVDVVLVAPDGREVVFTPGADPVERSVDGVTLRQEWTSDRSTALTLQRGEVGSGGWTGVWSVTAVDRSSSTEGARSTLDLHLTGDLVPAVTSPDPLELRAGETPELVFGLTDLDGEPVETDALLGTATFTAVLEPAGADPVVLADAEPLERVGDPHPLDLTAVGPGPAPLTLTLAVTTAPATDADGTEVPGTALEPQTVTLPTTVLPAFGYPTLGREVAFGTLEATTTADSVLPVTGPGCVWLAEGSSAVQTGPADVTGEVTSEVAGPGQLCLAEGQSGELPLRLTASETGNGALGGTLVVATAPVDAADDPGRVQQVELGWTADMLAPLQVGLAVATFLLALLLGLALPLLVLWLVKYALATIPGAPVLVRSLPVRLDGDVVTVWSEGDAVAGDGRPLSATHLAGLKELLPLGVRGSRRTAAAGFELRTAVGVNPFGAGHVVVRADGPVATSTSPAPAADGTGRLPLACQDQWAVSL